MRRLVIIATMCIMALSGCGCNNRDTNDDGIIGNDNVSDNAAIDNDGAGGGVDNNNNDTTTNDNAATGGDMTGTDDLGERSSGIIRDMTDGVGNAMRDVGRGADNVMRDVGNAVSNAVR